MSLPSTAPGSTLPSPTPMGDPLDGDSSGLFTTGGAADGEVFLWTDPTNNNIVLGTTTSVSPFDPDFLGDIVFAMYPAGDRRSGERRQDVDRAIRIA